MWGFDIQNKRTREFLENEVPFIEGLQHVLKTAFGGGNISVQFLWVSREQCFLLTEWVMD
jgi:hypothetical protein